MKKTSYSFTAGAASVTGFASNVTGASWALTATTPTDGLAHKLTIKGDAATDHSAKTAAIVGTDEMNRAQTETVALPNGVATVTSTKYWLTVTSITPSATINADTMDIGWAADCVTPWKDVMGRSLPVAFSLGVAVVVDSGSPTYTLQHTLDDVVAFDHSTVAAETTSQEGGYTTPVSAIRLKFTAAGAATLTAVAAHL